MTEGQGLPPTILVIFGISGDLSRRYLLPALAEIKWADQLPESFKIMGISRRDIEADKVLGARTKILADHLELFKMDLTSQKDFESLKNKLKSQSQDFNSRPQIIFYLVVPPSAVLLIVQLLGESGLNTKNVKLLLEKPFGVDLKSAREIIKHTLNYFAEEQLYRIDHYLAKGMAQNIAVFLGSNALFREVWNRKFIESIEIIAAETLGIEGRAEWWESTGTLRDFLQSHLLHLAALVLMEPCPHNFDFSQLPERRLAALQQIIPSDVSNQSVIRAQYKGYREEVKKPDSVVETFASATFYSRDPRWTGVPIKLATGKKLSERLSEIRVRFKKMADSETNLLVLRIQPREGIELDLWVKEPGYEHRLQKQPLKFIYEQRFGRVPNAYEQVLIDAFRSKQSLFTSSDEVLAAWRLLEPIQTAWVKSSSDLFFYPPGSSIEAVLQRVKT